MPDPVDIHVGQKIRQRRMLAGISQEKLASALGITFQQVQKYENGTNRVSASRLYAVSQFLKVPVSFFFDNITKAQTSGLAVAEKVEGLDLENLNNKETGQLIVAYYAIEDKGSRKTALEMIKQLAKK
jgi:transcriptional regulator with XRE-family HTH domain